MDALCAECGPGGCTRPEKEMAGWFGVLGVDPASSWPDPGHIPAPSTSPGRAG